MHKADSIFNSLRSAEHVRGHLARILEFWAQHARDSRSGGYINQLLADGAAYDSETRHLVASARFVVLFSIGIILRLGEQYSDAAAHAPQFLERAHRDRKHGGYHRLLRGTEVLDSRKQAYGRAFVILAGATAQKAEVPGAQSLLSHAVEICEEKFLEANGLASNTASEDWLTVSAYRGQNASMHLCEAFIAAYKATHDDRFLHRAYGIADLLGRRIAATISGFVWENYREDWSVDWDDKAQDSSSIESRLGISPGHQVEWAKLLGILARYHNAEWLLPQAVHLHRLAWDFGWNAESGGFYAALARDLTVSDPRPSYWSPAEAIGAAVVLLEQTGNPGYWEYYDRAWQYALGHLADPANGGWFKVPARSQYRENYRKGDMLEPDYHPASACYEVPRCMRRYQ